MSGHGSSAIFQISKHTLRPNVSEFVLRSRRCELVCRARSKTLNESLTTTPSWLRNLRRATAMSAVLTWRPLPTLRSKSRLLLKLHPPLLRSTIWCRRPALHYMPQLTLRPMSIPSRSP